ncbi:MAG: class I SAM-dependent methyltransferase [Bacilli bacterium]|nr:class I SAM-dependent methyltransferase [Bacilli bacterium]
MNEKELITYYNKFNEDKRLTTAHGQVEFLTSIKYIEKYLKKGDKIIDIGAGTGAYSIYFYDKGYDVTAVELVKHNLRIIEKKRPDLKTYNGNALNLSKYNDNSYDIVLIFGPMYHLISTDDKIKSLMEAKRIVKPNGYIFISYCMNEYAVITHGIKEGFLTESIKKKELDESFKIISKPKDLYSFVRIEDIDLINNKSKVKRVKILSQDGPTEYLKKEINKMDKDTFDIYLKYHFSTCERKELLGAGRHILDIVQK